MTEPTKTTLPVTVHDIDGETVIDMNPQDILDLNTPNNDRVTVTVDAEPRFTLKRIVEDLRPRQEPNGDGP